MRLIFALLILVSITSCARPPIKNRPTPQFSAEIKDPELKVITEEFFALSKRNNISFKKSVSIGFEKINSGTVIGTCSYGKKFREVTLDSDFWGRATWPSKIALVYHEMIHCYCGRVHDFEDGKPYRDTSLRSLIKMIMDRVFDNPFNPRPSPLKPEGFMDDGCPKSIMAPYIMTDKCFLNHYEEYTKEMFVRCEPW